ncbi:phosphotransferase [Pseudonocardia sp. RS010]|uniref:phosphotransferase n=1 Tax=Pseudonocardia sp. RS010 TaxID=3385979 RepID=UPI0039A01BAA
MAGLGPVGWAAGRVAATVGSRVVERVRRTPARTAADIPPGPAAVTPEWLTSVLCADYPGVRVTEVEASNRSSQTTSRVALRLGYSAGAPESLPTDVFVKFTETVQQRVFAGLVKFLDGEPEFYASLRGLADFECPLGYHGRVDRRSWASVVVMEDVAATRGATFQHATTAIDRPAIESLLSTMAAYHGQYWEHPAVVGSTLKRPEDHQANIGLFLNARKQAMVGVDRTPGFPAALRSRQDELWRALVDSMRELSHGGPQTLLHGDPHIGNTYRTRDGTVAFADWQVVMRGTWAYDFADTVATALTVEDRRAWERDLLAHYLDELARHGGKAPEFTAAFDLYRRSLMYPHYCWATVLGAPSWMPDTQPPDVARTIVERIGTAIDDVDAIAAFR